jgi:hypothetical protein
MKSYILLLIHLHNIFPFPYSSNPANNFVRIVRTYVSAWGWVAHSEEATGRDDKGKVSMPHMEFEPLILRKIRLMLYVPSLN